ncbi:MAG TPA: hypothetical protein VMM60_10955 [Ilumatobacter sp.]|nr:hypothetical protein [Ilumatobacter sp.]
MRQLFTVRFVAAVGGVVALFFALSIVFATREALVDEPPTGTITRGIDFVEIVFASTAPAFDVIDGVAAITTTLVIDGNRSLVVTAGTPGENYCDAIDQVGACAVLADLLGEGVVWFALVPRAGLNTVELPAIDTIEDGVATLVNGWEVPHAPVLDRRCPDDEFSSYRELREELGDEFVAIFDTVERRLVAVECQVQVAYLPPAGDTNDR